MAKAGGGRKAPRRMRRKRGRAAQNTDGTLNGYLPIQLPLVNRDAMTFVRWQDIGGLPRGSLDQGWAWTFRLADVASSTEFTALFDQYCIHRVRLVFSQLVSTSAQIQLAITSDYDNVTAPASFADVGQRRHVVRTLTLLQPVQEFTLVPRIRCEVSGPQLNEAALLPPSSWLDCAAPEVPHSGVIAWIIGYNTSTAASNLLNLRVEYTLGMRVNR